MSENGMDGSDALQAGQVGPTAMPEKGPGAQLAAQRQALGWSIEDVANQLNLAPRQVQALENDNYAALPGLVIARGFVRVYAKLLKIDPAPLVALMAQEPASTAASSSADMRRALPASFSESKLHASSRGSRSVLLIALAVVAIGVAGWLAYQNQWFAGLSGMIQAQGEQSALPSSAETSTPQESDTQNQVDDNAAGIPPEKQLAEAPKDAPATPSVVQDAAVQAGVTSEEKPINPAHNLVLKVREASWVEIKREDGTTMVARLLPAGATESFAIRRSAQLVVGNAAGVDATFLGKPLDLTAAAKSNVARLNLQQQ